MIDNLTTITELLNSLKDTNELIAWLKAQPDAKHEIKQVKGDSKTIVAVVPTTGREDFVNNTKQILNGIQILFVYTEGSFNFAKACNFGIAEALKYNPKWVLVCNDDMRMVDAPNKLIEELNNINTTKYDCLLPSQLENRASIYKERAILHYARQKDTIHRELQKFFDKYEIKYNPIGKYAMSWFKEHIFYKKICDFVNVSDFFIINSNYARQRNGKIYDELFLNGCEDNILSLSFNKERIKKINYRVDRLFCGGTLGGGIERVIRNVIPLAYFNFLIKSNPDILKRC